MKLISHRGNLTGRNPELENNPKYIDIALSLGYDCEIDIWLKEDSFYLGHDTPDYIVSFDWILERTDKLWLHCKNVESVCFFHKNKQDLNYFWHQTDLLTITSRSYLWVYPGYQPIEGSISVLPEIYNDQTTQCIGICSDYIVKYSQIK